MHDAPKRATFQAILLEALHDADERSDLKLRLQALIQDPAYSDYVATMGLRMLKVAADLGEKNGGAARIDVPRWPIL